MSAVDEYDLTPVSHRFGETAARLDRLHLPSTTEDFFGE